jgi:hypothetical protein
MRTLSCGVFPATQLDVNSRRVDDVGREHRLVDEMPDSLARSMRVINGNHGGNQTGKVHSVTPTDLTRRIRHEFFSITSARDLLYPGMKATQLLGILALSLPACGGTTGDVDTGEDPGPDAGTPTDTEDSDVGACSAEYPTAGMKVVFHDADGQPLGVAETDDAGVATFASCEKGGMVTLVRPSSEVDATRRLFTVQGVNPGDVVRFTKEQNVAMAVTPMSLTIQNNLDDVTQGATSYVGTLGACTSPVQALDGSSGGTLLANSLASCLGDDPTTLVALSIARDANSQPVGFARSSTTDLISPSIAAGGQWVAWSGPTQVMISNIPAGATTGFRTVIPKIDGVNYGLTYGSAPLTDGPLALQYWPTTIVDEHRIALSYSFSADETSSGALMRTTTPPAAIDASQMLLARPRTIVSSVVDPTRPLITWQDGDDRADFTRVELGFTDDAGPAAWVLVTAGNPRTLQVPVLDASHAGLGPSADSQTAVRQFLLIDRETTYAAHLAEGVKALSDDETADFLGVREVAGTTLRYAGYLGE